MSEDRPAAVFKSCTRITARHERQRFFWCENRLNWELKRSASVFVSEWSLFSCFRDGVPCWSRQEFFSFGCLVQDQATGRLVTQ